MLAPAAGDTYSLLRVMPHDKAITYASSHRFTVNEALGVVEVRDQAALEQVQPALEQAATATDARLFTHVSDKDMGQLGIDDHTRTIARLLTSEAHLDALERMISEAQYNALYLLAGGLSVEEVWQEVAQNAPSTSIDTDNLVMAMERSLGDPVRPAGPRPPARGFRRPAGHPVPGLQEGLTHTYPDPASVTSASLAPIGLGPAETSAIAALAAGREIPEVSDYIAFRLGRRDAFPSGDPSLQAGTAIRWPRATPPRIPSRGRRNTGVSDPDDVPPAVATTGTTSTCCPGPTARCVRRRAAREAPFRNKRRSANAGDAEVDA